MAAVSSPRSDQEQIEQEMARQLETVGDYKHGSIKRIKLTRFLTYSAVEFSPGPRCVMIHVNNDCGVFQWMLFIIIIIIILCVDKDRSLSIYSNGTPEPKLSSLEYLRIKMHAIDYS
jgi:hypothetical protein